MPRVDDRSSFPLFLGRHFSIHLEQRFEPFGVVFEAAADVDPFERFVVAIVRSAEEKPATPEGRIDRWQHRLLDLSLRNRLLNFKQTQQTLPFLCPDISGLEDLLAEGNKVRILSLPEENPQGDRDTQLHRQKTSQDLNLEFARQAMQRQELACPLSRAELDSRLTTLYRKVRNDLAEGGSNTLFLAVGFLKWKRNADDKTSFRAPLLLVPTKLTRKSAVSPFYLEHHEDEVRFNATLVQLLALPQNLWV